MDVFLPSSKIYKRTYPLFCWLIKEALKTIRQGDWFTCEEEVVLHLECNWELQFNSEFELRYYSKIWCFIMLMNLNLVFYIYIYNCCTIVLIIIYIQFISSVFQSMHSHKSLCYIPLHLDKIILSCLFPTFLVNNLTSSAILLHFSKQKIRIGLIVSHIHIGSQKYVLSNHQ